MADIQRPLLYGCGCVDAYLGQLPGKVFGHCFDNILSPGRLPSDKGPAVSEASGTPGAQDDGKITVTDLSDAKEVDFRKE